MVFNEILKFAFDQGASDAHLAVGYPLTIRVAGDLKFFSETIIYKETLDGYLADILTPEQLITFKKEKELDMAYEIKEVGRFRVNIFWEKEQPSLVARLIPVNIPSLSALGLTEMTINKINQLPDGLFLLTGPTGCGKSTTLAAIIETINQTRSANIITLEDPIEFVYTPKQSMIRQRQLGQDMLDYAEGLKHVLRQDPNVIMVGEMRDLETIATTLTCAETGHLVFATLHTQNAAQTIDRIIDVFPPYQQAQIKTQLSMSLRGVISQHLLPKIGGGRVAAREIMWMNPAIANLIRESKIQQVPMVMQTSGDQGMQTIEQSLDELIRGGAITEDTAQPYRFNMATSDSE